VKYIMFGVKNLDLQAEMNVMRPIPIRQWHRCNWSHYNQPLAHPLAPTFGADRYSCYQPGYRWNIELKCIYNKQGLDSAGENLGNVLSIIIRARANMVYIYSGIGHRGECLGLSFLSVEGKLISWYHPASHIRYMIRWRVLQKPAPRCTPLDCGWTCFANGMTINKCGRLEDWKSGVSFEAS
jgi:hypothetical protein